MGVEDEVESRKKLDEQMRRPQRQLREVERFTDVPQEVQSSLKEILQQQLQEKETAAAWEEMRKIREDI